MSCSTPLVRSKTVFLARFRDQAVGQMQVVLVVFADGNLGVVYGFRIFRINGI